MPQTADKYLSFKHLTDKKFAKPSKKQSQVLQNLTRSHIESFNYILHGVLVKSVQTIAPMEFELPTGDRVSLSYVDMTISPPTLFTGNTFSINRKIFPAECRERRTTYRGKIMGHILVKVGGAVVEVMEKCMGEVPIMVKSNACNLVNLSPKQLVDNGEEAEEMGGYFIINGLEKVIRMVVMPRRNYPLCLSRSSWKTRGNLFTEYGVSMRCVKHDMTSSNITLHYLSNGMVKLSFTYRKEHFFIPLMFVLKALRNIPDSFIYDQLVAGNTSDSYLNGCLTHMLRSVLNEGLTTQSSLLKYIGDRFRVKVNLPPWYTDTEVAEFIIKNCICIHLEDNEDKFNILVHMTRKLFSYVRGTCAAENPDSLMNHEVLLPGQLYLMVLRERLETFLYSARSAILKGIQKRDGAIGLSAGDVYTWVQTIKEDLTRPMEYLLATGNVVSKSGLGLMQTSGFSTVADKLNFFRYVSHFRCIHRGSFFAEMRTTTARKLLPEAWGFLCPVHTPDGTPCGLLNHMSAHCEIVIFDHSCTNLRDILLSLGVNPLSDPSTMTVASDSYPVLLDGCFIGYLPVHLAGAVSDRLRAMKVLGISRVPATTEIAVIPRTTEASQYPGLYIFTTIARMMRPVRNLRHKREELIGTFEQVYLDIALNNEDDISSIANHVEIHEPMLSVVASLVPFSNFNQSPRNMYQCQMAKQSMGTPCHALLKRADNKMYRVLFPQSPIVRPTNYAKYKLDEYPIGTNAIVAVISYSGYDMEDAMVLSKASYERGFAHGCIYKAEVIDLCDKKQKFVDGTYIFANEPGKDNGLEIDGLPPIGAFLEEKDSYYSYKNLQTDQYHVVKFSHDEGAYIEQIKVLGNDRGTSLFSSVCFLLRIPRNPIVGDKFASRHGQKGICSQKWPSEDMPFSVTGISPDILFNPHGYPSRMTIGMMIESMAGKSAAMSGTCHDATPFTYPEDVGAIQYFAEKLKDAGYSYYGTEEMYSGIDGTVFEAQIFIGVVYYQRLRHMVSDKFQVRTTGPVDNLTHQPVKGRQRAGGIRFGEMERDAVIAHGSSFVLHDRLFNCSDKSFGHVCTNCHSLLTASRKHASSISGRAYGQRWVCSVCKEKSSIQMVTIPHVLKYLLSELASMNIKVDIGLE